MPQASIFGEHPPAHPVATWFMGDTTPDRDAFVRMPAHRADAKALPHPNQLFYSADSDPEIVARAAEEMMPSYPVVRPILHVRVFNHDFSRFAIVVLHNFSGHDAELLVAASPCVCWTRAAVRGLARWIFLQLGFERITLRIRANDARLLDFAVRLGFRREGLQRRGFHDGQDCSLWGMLRSECRWINRGLPA